MMNIVKKIGIIGIVRTILGCCFIFALLGSPTSVQKTENWITYSPREGPGNGKHIVLVSGEWGYRSEEALPMLAEILAKRHGFKTTVLFAINLETGNVDPAYRTNIPGLQLLQTADLMVIFTRFRELPDEQMSYIDQYLKAGKPVVALRTATHAFQYKKNPDSKYAKYGHDSTVRGWEGGFGRHILGETWVDHHGAQGEKGEGTRGLVDGTMKRESHAVLRGVKDIWGPTGVYGTRKLQGDAQILLWGMPTNGLTPESAVNWNKTIMPVAWIKYYTSEEGNTGRTFTTTMGAAVDLLNEDLRRLIINGCYWAVGMDKQIPSESNVDLIGEYHPTMFGVGDHKKGLVPSDFK